VQRHIDDTFGSMLADVQQQLCMEALRRVVQKTPVDTGRAKGNWQVGVGESPAGELDTTDPGGEATIQKGNAKIKGLGAFGTCHITNNLPYIVGLEDGHSAKGSHMVESTLNELAETLL